MKARFVGSIGIIALLTLALLGCNPPSKEKPPANAQELSSNYVAAVQRVVATMRQDIRSQGGASAGTVQIVQTFLEKFSDHKSLHSYYFVKTALQYLTGGSGVDATVVMLDDAIEYANRGD